MGDSNALGEFLTLFDSKDKEGCVSYALSLLERRQTPIVDLYEQVLAPAARRLHDSSGERPVAIWEEHVRTSIIRTVLECCYPSLMRERRSQRMQSSHGRAVIVCPTEEFHELGARMSADFFTLCGFDATFVGANTPQDEIVEAASLVGPDYVGISVTSSYNLIAARRILRRLREAREETGGHYVIVAGGQAFAHEAVARELGADVLAQTYADIAALTGSRT